MASPFVTDSPVSPRVTLAPGASVRADRLTRRFGERTVLHDLDLQVESGSFVAIIGASGSGKTTLLRLLAGLDAPDGGRLSASTPAGAALTRVMFQEDRLLPWLSVLDNVTLGLPRDVRERALDTLAAVGLADRAAELPHRLSGGQKQRVALARALTHQPDLLLLDEPLGALDALTRAEMQRLIERLWQERGLTVVLVTHDIDEALTLAGRVLVLREGRIVRDAALHAPRPRARRNEELLTLREDLEGALRLG